MCGIAGFATQTAGQDRQTLEGIGAAMGNCIAHRGPEASGVWQDPDFPLVLAHRRLAIIDLSPGGAQPMISPSGRYVMVYNGEIYNYRTLQAELEAAGRIFKSRSDTEVMLVAFEHWGLNAALQKLNGQFAFALWDRQEKEIHLVRDRFGKKPLYVGWAGDTFLFASELKAFHAHPHFKPEVDRNALSIFMRYGYVQAPYSIFKNVWQLLPASRLTLALPHLKPGKNLAEVMEYYWSLRGTVEQGWAHISPRSEVDLINDFEDKLRNAVSERMIADVPLGAFLSGGIDSSTIVALMQQAGHGQVKTFSIGFTEDGYDESAHAAKVAAHLGTDHRAFTVTAQDALAVIPKLPDIYDEPFADASQIPTYLLSRMAKEYVTVALTGDGGDEMLGGYQRHTHIPPFWNRIGWIPYPARRLIGGLLTSVPMATYDRMQPDYPQFGRRFHRLAKMLGEKNITGVYDSLLRAWHKDDGLVLGGSVPALPLTNDALWPQNLSFAERMIFGDALSYRPDDLMVKSDRAAMAVALEARAPLMDYKLWEYSWTLPPDMKIRGVEGKWILRRILDKYVPRDLIDRPKTGFGVPLRDWLRGPLREWAGDLLSRDALKAQGYLNADMVGAAWDDLQAGGQSGHASANDLWSALMFQAWRARWMDT